MICQGDRGVTEIDPNDPVACMILKGPNIMKENPVPEQITLDNCEWWKMPVHVKVWRQYSLHDAAKVR
jgi:hypothetical protein